MAKLPLRVIIVDDDLFVREILSSLINGTPDLQLVGAAGSAAEVIALLETQATDVILMDINLPDLDGTYAAGTIAAQFPYTRIVMLTSFDDDQLIRQALASGASGYLLKSSPPDAILDAIRAAASGSAVISPPVLRRIAPSFTKTPSAPKPLTAGENEVLQLLVGGHSNAAIAETLYISPSTVKSRLTSIGSKLGTTSRVAIAVRAIQLGLINDAQDL